MNRKTFVTLFLLLLIVNSLFSQNAAAKKLRLWYDKPAYSQTTDVKRGSGNDAEWLKALPVGNGFMGAMVFGDVNNEIIQLNEKSLWSGSPDENNNPEAAGSLNKIRRLLFEKKYKEANGLTEKTQVCKCEKQMCCSFGFCLESVWSAGKTKRTEWFLCAGIQCRTRQSFVYSIII